MNGQIQVYHDLQLIEAIATGKITRTTSIPYEDYLDWDTPPETAAQRSDRVANVRYRRPTIHKKGLDSDPRRQWRRDVRKS